MTQQTYEVEIRGLLTKEKFEEVLSYLKASSQNFEEDNRETLFFMLPNATLKVAKLVSKGYGKVAYKSGDIVNSTAQKEIEYNIDIQYYDKAIEVFKHIGFTDIQKTEQIRYNCVIDEMEVSLKWSKDWGYHFEAEIVCSNEHEVESIKQSLIEKCLKIDLKAMSIEEFEEFRSKIDSAHRSK